MPKADEPSHSREAQPHQNQQESSNCKRGDQLERGTIAEEFADRFERLCKLAGEGR